MIHYWSATQQKWHGLFKDYYVMLCGKQLSITDMVHCSTILHDKVTCKECFQKLKEI